VVVAVVEVLVPLMVLLVELRILVVAGVVAWVLLVALLLTVVAGVAVVALQPAVEQAVFLFLLEMAGLELIQLTTLQPVLSLLVVAAELEAVTQVPGLTVEFDSHGGNYE
jgi:hypothetical protein